MIMPGEPTPSSDNEMLIRSLESRGRCLRMVARLLQWIFVAPVPGCPTVAQSHDPRPRPLSPTEATSEAFIPQAAG